MADWQYTSLIAGSPGSDTFPFAITGLSASTVYEYRAYMVVDGNVYTGQTLTATTTNTPTYAPTVKTGSVTSVSSTGFTTSGSCVCTKGGLPVAEYGMLYSQATSSLCYNTSCKQSVFADIATGTSYSNNISGLAPNTMTYFTAFAKNVTGIGCGCICCQQTIDNPKYINLFCTSGYNSGSLSYKVHCITPTLPMVIGESYNICLDVDLCTYGQAAGSFSYAHITCNGSTMYCCCMVIPQPCQIANVSFPVDYNDTVMIYNCACVTDTACAYGAASESCIRCIVPIFGSFCKGVTCTCSCAYTG